MPLDGTQLGRYRLLHLIGSGGMGEVYLAEDVRIARRVAIKVVRTEATMSTDEPAIQENERLFQREMKAITLLDHPHILPLYDFGEETRDNATFTYMVMPYRSEGSLSDWLRKHDRDQPLSPQDIAHIIAQAADALQHAHNHQIVHQDVKPSNFLVRNLDEKPERPDLLLADFGIAKLITSTTSMSQNIRGTPVYMAPEQWEGHPVFATDQYALGVMAYQLLTRRAPFSGRLEQLMHQHFHVQPHPPSRLSTRLSPAVDAVILRALAKKPEERFPSISSFARAFQQALQYGDDLRTTLAISQEEARQGTQRLITLPGSRRIPVTIPPAAHDGQVLRLPEQGELYYDGGPRGPLLLTIMLKERSTPLPPDNKPSSTPETLPINPVPSPPPVPDDQPIPIPPAVPVLKRIKLSPLQRILFVSLAAILLISGAIGASSIYQQQIEATQATALTATTIASNPASRALTVTAQTIATNAYPAYLSKPQNDHGGLTLVDPLNQAEYWQPAADTSWGSSCTYTQSVYDVTQTKIQRMNICFGESDYADFAVEVQMKIIRGDCGGLDFRDDNSGRSYIFDVCQNGSYALSFYSNNTTSQILLHSTSPYIRQGLKQPNTIAVKARGSSIDLYINQKWVENTTDNSQSAGSVGFLADATNNPTEVTYTNVRIWVFG